MGVFLLLEASQPDGTVYRLALGWFLPQKPASPSSCGCSKRRGHLGKRGALSFIFLTITSQIDLQFPAGPGFDFRRPDAAGPKDVRWSCEVCWSRRAYRVQRGNGPASALLPTFPLLSPGSQKHRQRRLDPVNCIAGPSAFEGRPHLGRRASSFPKTARTGLKAPAASARRRYLSSL